MKQLFALLLFLLSYAALAHNPISEKLVLAAVEGTKNKVTYDPGYFVIKYPGGDVPKGKGVCTDVIIRAYRAVDIDLQQLVHEDMNANFAEYPSKKIWGLKKTDTNIDHRRVPNLQIFFERKGKKLSVSSDASNYKPGDIVTWNISGSKSKMIHHIGMVIDKKSKDGKRNLVVHNIGNGHQMEDALFEFPITGHYQYFP